MKKIVIWSESKGLIDIKKFDNKEKALIYADMIWQHLTKNERKTQRLFVGYVDIDTLDVWDVLKEY